jgi:hypothetical protein
MEKDYQALMKTEERTTRELRQTLGYEEKLEKESLIMAESR